MKKYFLIFVLLVICGCNAKPADVPQLYPCQIIVTKNSTPIGGVHVVLGLTSDSSPCAVFGVTNSSGIATICTNRLGWRGNGAPAGEYIVTISKEPKLENELSTEEYQKLDPIKQEQYQLEQQRKYNALPREIPADMSDITKSSRRLTVTKDGENVLNIDIATNNNPQ
ncbi:MAG: hypothetical protein LBB88_01255 [Planctomycetaceae bacterium]|jgi:hypothetical protein|nr:hypothetical protein [Planctomycetaceae bacterium]